MAQDVGADPVRYEFGPPEDPGVAFGLAPVQLAVIVGTLLVAITAAQGGVSLLAAGLLAAPVLAWGAGRWRGQRITTLTGRWLQWALRPRRGGHGALTATASTPRTIGEVEGPVPSAEVPAPGWARQVRLLEVPYGDATVGVWCDGDAYATVLAVRAPATALRDLGEQEAMLANWGDLLAAAGVEGSPVERIAWVARTSPDQAAGAATWMRERADTTVRLAQPSLWASYLEVGEATGTSAVARELLMVVRIQPERARHRLRGVRGREEREQAAGRLAIAETERIGGRLVELGCQIEGLYTPGAVAEVVRTTCDPSAREDLARWRAAVADGGNQDPGVSPSSGMWPLSHEEAADHVRVDGAYHRVGWIEEWPTVPVLANWLHPLVVRSSCTRAVAMVMEPMPTHTAVRATHRARASAASEAEVRQRHGFLTSARADRTLASAEQREQELIDGHRDLRFAGYVVVSAPSLGELEEAWATTIYESGQARLRLRALHGEHWPALGAVLPLGRFF